MGLQEIKSEILNEARQKAEEIEAEAKERKEEIIEEAEEKADKIREQEQKKLEEQKESLRQRELSNARMEAKQEKMEAKQEMIDQVFSEFSDYLGNLSRGENERLVESCLGRVEFNVGKIKGSKEFREAVDHEFEEIDREGIVVVSENGERRQSFTYDKITEEYRERYRKKVAELLFQD